MNIYKKNKESSNLKYWDVNILYGWGIASVSEIPLGGFKWVEKPSQFNENYVKSYNDDSDEWYFLKIDVQYPENLHSLHNDLNAWKKTN